MSNNNLQWPNPRCPSQCDRIRLQIPHVESLRAGYLAGVRPPRRLDAPAAGAEDQPRLAQDGLENTQEPRSIQATRPTPAIATTLLALVARQSERPHRGFLRISRRTVLISGRVRPLPIRARRPFPDTSQIIQS